jgi:hypothetical protein
MNRNWIEFKPGVNKTMLILIAGIVWIGVGMMLSRLAILWWQNYAGSYLPLFLFIALLLGMIKGYFILTRVVSTNIRRINQLNGTNFILAFISVKTYLLIIGMMILGFVLRHSLFPKHYLAILYLGAGLAMIISSVPYFKILVNRYLEKIPVE